MDKSDLENLVYELKKERDQLQKDVWNLESENHKLRAQVKELEYRSGRAYDRYVTNDENRGGA
jgi:chaperonin cofactor prefoldin